MEFTNSPIVKSMSDEVLTKSLTRVSRLEREVTANVVEHIREFMTRRLYLEHGFTSMFSYLVQKLNYAKSTAQNRIDAARLLLAVPEFQNDLATGELNLAHVTVLSQAMRQHEKEKPHLKLKASDKRRLLEKMKGQDASQSAVIVAKDLDLSLKTAERSRVQKDESIRLEITLAKEQMEKLKRVRDLSSHQNHNASWVEVIEMLSDFYIAKKDPTVERMRPSSRANSRPRSVAKPKPKSDSKVEIDLRKWNEGFAIGRGDEHVCDNNIAARGSKPNFNLESATLGSAPNLDLESTVLALNAKREAIPAETKRIIFRRDRVCRWVHPENGQKNGRETGTICGGTFQLQIDHVKPVHQGGGNQPANLQVLCGVHNRLKYRIESSK